MQLRETLRIGAIAACSAVAFKWTLAAIAGSQAQV